MPKEITVKFDKKKFVRVPGCGSGRRGFKSPRPPRLDRQYKCLMQRVANPQQMKVQVLLWLSLIAQLAEHVAVNHKAVSSNLTWGEFQFGYW